MWAAVGALGALGLISLGPIALGSALIIGVLIARSPTARTSIFGLVTGVGLPLLVVAYVQRDGPGTTCWHTATAAGCDQHLNPIPWLALGLVLAVGGLLAQIRRNA